MSRLVLLAFVPLCVLLGACGDEAKLPPGADTGPTPQLSEPRPSLIPTVNVADAKGWLQGHRPTVAAGFSIAAFATGLEHPRWLAVLPNGDVLVAETNGPPRPDDGGGIRGWAMRYLMGKAGAGGKSANRITLLRDADRDGVAEFRSAFLTGLNSPFGMALVGSKLFVANTDEVVAFDYQDGATEIRTAGTKLANLPGGPLNHHWTKSLIASEDGKRLYVGVGSNSNVAENGLEKEEGRAAIWEIDAETGKSRVFASGLRNPVGLALEPTTKALWAVVNERDELGSDLVPDYLTHVTEGGFYGWPYSYFGQHVDERVKPQAPDLVAKAVTPDYAVGTHTGTLGLAFVPQGGQLPGYGNGAILGQHGSWNRVPRSGYRVAFVPFENGKPSGDLRELVTGFVNDETDEAYGRPVGVSFDREGALLVADDVGNTIWRVTAAHPLSSLSPGGN
jgi:glucose/arabinose dehydrogenase